MAFATGGGALARSKKAKHANERGGSLGCVCCFGGAKGAGKDRVKEEWLRNYPWFDSDLRYTTREREVREGHLERDGVDYHFVDGGRFSTLVKKGKIQAVDVYNGNMYGVDVNGLVERVENGERIVGTYGRCSLEIKRRLGPQAILIYVKASLKVIHERLAARGLRGKELDQAVEDSVITGALEEGEFDYIVYNDGDIGRTLQDVERCFEQHAEEFHLPMFLGEE